MYKYQHKRRIVLRSMSTIAVVSAAGVPLSAFALEKVDPKEAQAVSLGYTDDTTKVDGKKFPKHDNSQTCSNCQFYQTAQETSSKEFGKIAPCTVFGGKGVAAKGWCSAHVKKQG
jgi:hypothetical protein